MIDRDLERHPNGGPVRVLSKNGSILPDTKVPDLSPDELLEMYRDMLMARRFDERAFSLSRQGRLGTYTPMAGQEGAQIGSVYALNPEDWFIPSYREHGAKIALGMNPRDIMLYWMGNEEGNRIPEELNIFPVGITVGSTPLHATGMAWASKLRDEERAFLCNFGDGATSEGDFHEGLNFAGVFDLPVVFFCNNNQWAISVPRERQTASNTIAQKATAYGFQGIQVDGMDPLAVYQVTKRAVAKTKNPSDDQSRSTLIEAVMYRFAPHTNVDDPSVYRDDDEVERWKEFDPIDRFGTYLRSEGLLDDETNESIETEIQDILEEAVDQAEQFTPDPSTLFDNVFAKPTPRLADHSRYLEHLRTNYGDDALRED